IPNSKLIVVENAGHLILYERHEELNRLIEEFVQKL
ncbi:MAG: alpha/beta hydrolase, partial [Thaumarchaeota archaeon]